jgi:hypothetical protein
MKILGIDPGIERVGFGLIECLPNGTQPKALDWGVIKTCKTKIYYLFSGYFYKLKYSTSMCKCLVRQL